MNEWKGRRGGKRRKKPEGSSIETRKHFED